MALVKYQLDINVELASPLDFIPAPADWRQKSIRIDTIGQVEFFHFDLYSQALAKLERGHDQDISDVTDLVRLGYISAPELIKKFGEIKPALIRYPAIDPLAFEKKIRDFVKSLTGNEKKK